MIRRLNALLLTLLLAVSSVAVADNPKVVMETSLGNFTIELFAVKATKSTKNFLKYVDDGYYDGLLFHRVIPNFMAQAGGFEPGLVRKQTRGAIENEANNGLKNTRGTLAMARTGDPHSATAQFFINVNDNPYLDFKSESRSGWGYAVFGQVIEGMDVVDKIVTSPTGNRGSFQNVPKEDIVILKASRLPE
ncbi:peptidyl-prolyl cis-trans isomerase [Aestuariirhabdus sp. Z084]|uniref:peptidylprolyl isomerase n=1 Tax=Aestuariirhabdus haliotis TaxID=2918751 RepID=UPI00201B3CC0|nr:peptidylprolyl isomerase [Aestuariirhabdus haliotis]MCL6415741.1 peptidyl-prolyl cis-trans isomerase [Aestuariirhabdus haliotis]MCL6419658.1 peptidyl-prolyl cis-trans isomerase [Aestuariirhabdus haliotis]